MNPSPTSPVSLPDPTRCRVVVPAPGQGPGHWSGAASALLDDGRIWLVWRERRPLDLGRGVNVFIAVSDDGETFETVATVSRDGFEAESFEKPALVRRPDGGWRLYLSCATPNSKHWWIEALDADDVDELPRGTRAVVVAGDASVGVKDPVVLAPTSQRAEWLMWVCEHPLTEPGQEDRMTTSLWRSPDGLEWSRDGVVLSGLAGRWDARGARLTAVLSEEPFVALYDGRASAEENWHEATALATGPISGPLLGAPEPIRSPDSDGAFRYATWVPTTDGRRRFYVERARPDGAHDLVTCVV